MVGSGGRHLPAVESEPKNRGSLGATGDDPGSSRRHSQMITGQHCQIRP